MRNCQIKLNRGLNTYHFLQIVLALSDVGLTEADVDFIKYFINLFMYYTADVMKVSLFAFLFVKCENSKIMMLDEGRLPNFNQSLARNLESSALPSL